MTSFYQIIFFIHEIKLDIKSNNPIIKYTITNLDVVPYIKSAPLSKEPTVNVIIDKSSNIFDTFLLITNDKTNPNNGIKNANLIYTEETPKLKCS